MSASIKIVKDFTNKQITVISEFKAPKEKIWDAFTNPDITDKWWAPKPYQAITKQSDFKNGGQWLYYMLSTEGEKHWCLAEFYNIKKAESYEVTDAFCDEKGNINTNFPRMNWKNSFEEENGTTRVTNEITYARVEDMKQILEMGFEEGYSMGLNQLNDLLNEKKI
ncbi:SRPBCC family protein [Flavobacterium aquiphilum]|uniref:SRPBCC family protein n=1 Tax=Flavobacterium aquiphilum TaxID=3003261 RepID=UPI002480EF54|nr:SRPBCC domain-containing protein [Flavobacterium aquiphilum]